jgi:hypothetical protein
VETGEERSVVMRAKDQTVLPENRRKMLSPIYARELCGIALIHFGRQQKSGQWTEKLSVGSARMKSESELLLYFFHPSFSCEA